jgi:hypothetical protein
MSSKMTAALRAAHAEAGVKRCYRLRHAGCYSFMPHAQAVQACRKWIIILRHVRAQHPDEPATA